MCELCRPLHRETPGPVGDRPIAGARARREGAPARRLTGAARLSFAPPWIPCTPASRSTARARRSSRYLADIANHREFSDHYMTNWHLTRIDSVGRGAGARFRVGVAAPALRLGRHDARRRSSRRTGSSRVGRYGKFNRIKTTAIWTLDDGPGGGTDVEYMIESEPALPTDRIVEALSGQRR